MMHEGIAHGTILVARDVVAPFSDAHIALIQTFADQAVIAIENVRLLTELQEKNPQLVQAHGKTTEALEQQMAASEILRAISASPTDVQPVFDAIAASSARLCDALWRRRCCVWCVFVRLPWDIGRTVNQDVAGSSPARGANY